MSIHYILEFVFEKKMSKADTVAFGRWGGGGGGVPWDRELSH